MMADVENAACDYPKDYVIESKRAVSLGRRYNAANFRIPFRINWVIISTVIASMLLCQFTEFVAGRQASSSHGKRHYDRYCSERSVRRSMAFSQASQSVAKDPPLTPQDVLSRLEAAAVLRDNLVTTLGHVLLLCLDDDARIPFERVHDAVRNRRVAIYELLHILPVLRNKVPKQQLYKLLQMLERVDNRFVSEYASLCINAFPGVDVAMEGAPFADMLLDVDQEVIESISRDKRRTGAMPPSLTKDIDSLLRAARNDSRILNLRIASAILLNYPTFDLTNPEVHNAVRFVAQRMEERSRSDDPLLRYMGPSLANATDFLRNVLERLEIDELSSETTREAISLLLENFGVQPYPPAPSWKGNLKELLTITNDYYPANVVAVAKYLVNRLDDSHLQDLDIGFYETGDRALLQVLSRLRGKSNLRHLRKPLSLLTPFVSQKLINDANYDYAAPVNFYEVNEYLDSFDTPCLQQNISDAMRTLRPHLSKDLPWTYALGDRRASENPWELMLTSLVHLRNVPMNKPRANAIDNFVYKSRTNGLTDRRGLLYDSGIIFQRDDSTDVEVDFYSLLMRIPNAFKSEKFASMLNFLSKPNILDILGYEFNKFEYETPRSLLLSMLKRALTLSLVTSDESLARALQNAHNYLEEPSLVNLYIPEDLQLLLKYLPGIDSDPRYLPLKILFKKQKLFAYLSTTFSLAGLRTPIERLLLILQTVSLKVTQPKLSEALNFAVDNINGPPLPIKTFDRPDFVYLVQQLLSRNKTLQNEILTSYAYANVGDWNISISGTPENVLARTLSYPINSISSDMNLAELAKQAENILEREGLIDIEILKKQTLEAMLEYLPNNTYVKPVNLLLRKANLMMLVPKLNLTILESVTAREALITLLKNLTESRVIRAEKLLLRRIRAALSSLDGASEDDRQTPIFAYLTQSLQDPSNVVYKPLLREIGKLRDVTVSSEERQGWWQSYLERIVAENRTEKLTKAASMALREIAYDEDPDEVTRVNKARIGTAVSLLPVDAFAESLRKLLTPDWTYGILPDVVRNSDSLEKEELLLAILRHAKRRTDIAGNHALTTAISKVEISLNGWRANVEPLRSAAAAVKAAVYDPARNLLTATGLNKIKVTIPSGRSAKVSLLGLLHRLLLHPVIKRNTEVFKLLSAIRQDVFAFGIDVDLLTVLDDVGIAYIDELAPIRLFLHRRDVNEKLGQTVFAIVDTKERYRALLDVLQKQHQMDNDTRFLDALSTLKNIQPGDGEAAGISDLEDIVNIIPHHVRQQFKSIEHLFKANILSHFTSDNEIVRSKTPLITLLSKIEKLPEISGNYTAVRELNKLRSNVEYLNSYSIVTSSQLRPLLLELRHVQQINIDYLNSILEPEILGYLNSDEFSDMPNDNTDKLRTIVDYLLDEGPAYVDYNMRKHLQSFKRALVLTIGSSKTSKRHLTKEDWEKMLVLISHRKEFAPIKIFLQSKEIVKYIPKGTDWKTFSTPVKKLLHLLSLLENDEIENEYVYKSARKLRDNLEERFDFVTEQDIKSMHRTLASLNLKYDLAPLKIFLNHDNIIKYLSPDFRYTKYSTPIDAFAAVLDDLLQVPSLRRKVTFYNSVSFVRQALRERISSTRRSLRGTLAHKQLSSKDLEFVGSLNTSVPKLGEFLKPEKLASLLPKSFTFDNRPTYKTKMLHLLWQLLKLNTDVHSELEELVWKVETYPDVPNITRDDLAPLLNILPVEGLPYVELVKKYLKPTALIKLLPGNFDIKRASNARVALHDVSMLLSFTLGSAKNDKLKIALDALISELTKISSEVIPEEAIVDSNDMRAVIKEIPFNKYKQIERLKEQMATKRVISSLPLNFQLIKYKTKKLRVLAVLDELSKNNTFRSSLNSINFARRIISKMPDMPTVNDTEIEKLLSPLPLNTFYLKLLVTNCKVATLMPYLPIHFNLSSIESRKTKLARILHYCKLANPTDVSTRQALTNAEALLKTSPDFDVTRDHVEALIRTIPCTHFTSIKPLLRFLSRTDVAPLLPWDLDLYRASRTFKLRVFDLLTALRNVKELQSDEMFSALDSLETNARSLPEQVHIPQDRVKLLNATTTMSSASCVSYRDFATETENLIQILPPNYHFRTNGFSIRNEWSLIMYFSTLFLRDVKINGTMREAFKACTDNMREFERKEIFNRILDGLNYTQFKHLVPLRLYTLGHADTLTAPIEDIYRGFLHGPVYTMMRVVMMEFIRRPELTSSKSLLDDMEVYLHDYIGLMLKEINKELYQPSPYEIDRAIDEIPNDRRYDDLRLLTQCQDIRKPIAEKILSADDTPRRLLLEMLELAEKGDIDEEIRQSIKTLKPNLVDGIHEEEVEYALKQMRDYRYHASKVEVIRRYLVKHGLQSVLGGTDDFHTKYPTYKDRLFAINDVLSTDALARPADFPSEYHAALDHLNRTLHNEIKIEHIVPRTMDDINVQSLFFALPKTRDERIIRGIIKFFSIPDLLHKLNLPKDPFEYATKGRLLRAIMDLGQELEIVQQDPVQQEALEYFRDKIILTGSGAQPIELKKYAHDSNVDVDMYGVMRAIDYARINETDAVNVAMFFERKYDKLVHTVGFDHMAYATRGAYLKALLEHLVNVSQVPDDMKQRITLLLPAVRLDGPGNESIDLNVDVIYEETLNARMFEEFPLNAPHNVKSRRFLAPAARFETEMPQTFREKKESLRAAIDNMLETISSSEEEYLRGVNGQSNVYEGKTRIVIGTPQHPHDTRRKLDSEQTQMRSANSNSSLEKVRTSELRLSEVSTPLSNLTKVLVMNGAKTKRQKNDRSTIDDIPSNKIHLKYKIAKKAARAKSKNDLSSQMKLNSLDYLSDESNDISKKWTIKSLAVASQELSSEEPSKRLHRSNQERHKMTRFFIQPDTSIDIEYDDSDRNTPIVKMFRDMLQRNEEDLSLTKELMAEQTRRTGEKTKTVKKDLSRYVKKKRSINSR